MNDEEFVCARCRASEHVLDGKKRGMVLMFGWGLGVYRYAVTLCAPCFRHVTGRS